MPTSWHLGSCTSSSPACVTGIAWQFQSLLQRRTSSRWEPSSCGSHLSSHRWVSTHKGKRFFATLPSRSFAVFPTGRVMQLLHPSVFWLYPSSVPWGGEYSCGQESTLWLRVRAHLSGTRCFCTPGCLCCVARCLQREELNLGAPQPQWGGRSWWV